MAISVAGTANGGGGPATPNLPGTPAQNDLIVVATGTVGGNTYDVTTSGYTTVATLDGGNAKLRLYAKRMGGSPDSTVDIGPNAGAYAIWNMRGVDTTTFEDAVAIITDKSGGGVGEGYDSESITTVTANAWVFTGMSLGFSLADPSGAPSTFGNFVKGDFTSPNTVCVAGAWKEKATAGAEDPGVFPDADSNGSTVVSWAIRPAAAAAGGNSKNMLLMGVG